MSTARGSGRRIGFACVWDRPNPERTWSYTPWQLRAAMRRHAAVVDVGVDLPARAQLGLKALHARRRGGRLVTTWQQSRLTDALFATIVRRQARAAGCDAVLEIGDLADPGRPFFVYQDFSFDALLHATDVAGVPLPLGLTRRDVLRRRDRQRRIYERATGVLTMSRWLARHLVEVSGLPPATVHVVNPGRSAVAEARGDVPLPVRDRPRRRLLLVGTDLRYKAGDQVVAALAILRRDVDPEITLTVAGPAAWALPGPVPPGIRLLGYQSRADVARLYDTHDLFVMPSRFEGFGIVFAEAVARGLPCVARDAYAMPEVVQPGVTGALVTGEDPAELARVVAATLDDDSLYAKCRAHAPTAAAWYTWERAGEQAVAAIETGLSGAG